jgi:hypothetical protein
MPRATTLALAAVLLAVLPAAAGAQDKDKICRDVQNRPMTVGQWATYTWTGGMMDSSNMRFAIVGTEAQGGVTYYWYEMAIEDPKHAAKGTTIMQMLVPGLAYGAGGLRAMVMKSGNEPAMRMPEQMITMMGSRMAPNITAEISRRCLEMDVVAWEDVTVPEGTFHALHIRNPRDHTEAWVRPELYFGMVKVVTKDGAVMALVAHGGGAKSSITETPREMGPRD